MNLHRLTIDLERDQVDALKIAAVHAKKTVREIIAELVSEFLRKQGRKK